MDVRIIQLRFDCHAMQVIGVTSILFELRIKPRILKQFFSSTSFFWLPFEHPFDEPDKHLLVLAMHMNEHIVEIESRWGLTFADSYGHQISDCIVQ